MPLYATPKPNPNPALDNADAAALRERIREASLALGFGDVGFVRVADLLVHPEWQASKTRLSEWLDQNYHADMAWMRKQQALRTDPDALLPGVQTIVVVTLNHFQGQGANPPEQPIKIAQYAWGKDYHRLIRKRLQKLLEQIQQWAPGCQGRPVADSAPLLEKPLAVLAGLGWQGKNTLLISKTQGSYLFLGELLLDIDIAEPLINDATSLTTPPPDFCGSCTRCINACPTNAFPEPRVLDSTKCLSYWTIESPAKEGIPDTIAHNMHGWVFGCDICQQVCPWNQRFAVPTTDEAFSPRPWLAQPDADTFLNMTNPDFDQKMANNPIRRTGLAALKRNIRAAIAPP